MSHENDYFHHKSKEKLAYTQRQQALEALRETEIKAIEELFNTTSELAERVYALGFDADSARILFLVPIIQIAWADGKLDKAEHNRLLEIAKGRGISEEQEGPAWTFFQLLTAIKPEDEFFEKVAQLVSDILHDGGYHDSDDIYEKAVEMANLSGGFLGLGNIHKNEKKLLEDFKHLFVVEETKIVPTDYLVTTLFEVKDKSKVDQAKQDFIDLRDKTLKEKGCHTCIIQQDKNEPTHFIIWYSFENKEAYQNHLKSEHTKAHLEKNLTEIKSTIVANSI